METVIITEIVAFFVAGFVDGTPADVATVLTDGHAAGFESIGALHTLFETTHLVKATISVAVIPDGVWVGMHLDTIGKILIRNPTNAHFLHRKKKNFRKKPFGN